MSAPMWTAGPWVCGGNEEDWSAEPADRVSSFSVQPVGPLAASHPVCIVVQVYGQDFRKGDAELDANARLIAAAPELADAAQDALAGWRYIRQFHGDLYGVGWDRVEDALVAALTKAMGASS